MKRTLTGIGQAMLARIAPKATAGACVPQEYFCQVAWTGVLEMCHYTNCAGTEVSCTPDANCYMA